MRRFVLGALVLGLVATALWAQVQLSGTTDAQGKASIKARSGTYSIFLEGLPADTELEGPATVQIPPGGQVAVALTAYRKGVMVLTLIDGDTGQPIEGVQVILERVP